MADKIEFIEMSGIASPYYSKWIDGQRYTGKDSLFELFKKECHPTGERLRTAPIILVYHLIQWNES